MTVIIKNVTKLKERVDSPPKNFDAMSLTQISSEILELKRQREVMVQEGAALYIIKTRKYPFDVQLLLDKEALLF